MTAPSLTVALFPFCSLLELVVTSLKTDPGWRSGAGGWRMLWGKSFFSKPMRWSSISKNWAIFKLIHSWKSNWHLCWWRCWNELTYLSIFPAFFLPFLTSSLTSIFTCNWKEHCNSNTEIAECFPPGQVFLISLEVEAGESLRPKTLNLYRRLRPYRSLNVHLDFISVSVFSEMVETRMVFPDRIQASLQTGNIKELNRMRIIVLMRF